jgi:rubrerythrin
MRSVKDDEASGCLPLAGWWRYSPEMTAEREPYVFECRQCGKVFEAYTTRSVCPECDSADVARLTD